MYAYLGITYFYITVCLSFNSPTVSSYLKLKLKKLKYVLNSYKCKINRQQSRLPKPRQALTKGRVRVAAP